MTGRVVLSKFIYITIRILQNLAKMWEVDLRSPAFKLEVRVVRVVHFSRIALAIRPNF